MADGKKPPPFFCPRCGQKHRANLAPLQERPGTKLRTPCQGCGAGLAVRLEEGAPVVEVVAEPAPKPAPKAAPKAPPKPAKPPAPAGGPYEREIELAPGEHAGRYEIEALLGRGHTATIYRAHDPETKRTVALKVLGGDADEDARTRFERQIQVQGRIRHPNVLPVYDRGTLPDGRPFFAAELLHEPRTLEALVERVRAGGGAADDGLSHLSDVTALVREILLPVAEGTYVANVENGQIHRDLGPANVLVDGRTGRPYLTDFSHAAPPAPDTKAPPVPLSHYIAPESTIHRAHPRTDVWGLGALLHLFLAGEPPLSGRGRALLEAARKGRVNDLPADAPPALAAIARKALAPDPEHRYVNARQMAADLRAWLQGGTVRAVEEYGGQAAHRVELRDALRRGARLAGWAVGGLLVGLLVGSRIKPGGDGGASLSLDAAAREVERIDREISALGDHVGRLGPDAAARTWAALQERLDGVVGRAAATEGGGGEAVAARARHARGRLLVNPVEIAVPGGGTFLARSPALERRETLQAGVRRADLAPGRHVVDAEAGGLSLPLRLDLAVAPPGGARTLDVRRIEIPREALEPPEGTAFVPGGTLPAAGAKLPAAGATTRVPGFFVDRRPVTVGAWRAFVAALDEEGRAALGEIALDDADDAPVRVRPAQAEAYCRWRAQQAGRVVRLPTEAEWMLAAGAGAVTGPLAPPPVAPPHGVEGLPAAPPEMAEDEDGGIVLKGAADDVETAAWIFARRGSGEEAPAAFRCVVPLR